MGMSMELDYKSKSSLICTSAVLLFESEEKLFSFSIRKVFSLLKFLNTKLVRECLYEETLEGDFSPPKFNFFFCRIFNRTFLKNSYLFCFFSLFG